MFSGSPNGQIKHIENVAFPKIPPELRIKIWQPLIPQQQRIICLMISPYTQTTEDPYLDDVDNSGDSGPPVTSAVGFWLLHLGIFERLPTDGAALVRLRGTFVTVLNLRQQRPLTGVFDLPER
ncbi:hypothetical protein ACKVWC_008772 [Pyricularia oryzae]|nr:hypothetical protein MCOR01_002115 [Pyricularia oryzae]KAI6288179.1 hypothetical protein MCOR26_000187 [Pyricularia oryzae]KAI6322974.1 hypothetical protein MCOR34_002055 [Pyricularia oryzae]KAI6345573.1 hypothetical protein MCOR28_003493 [Pyricularia oryzae]KAI6379708.1 hypothetical protein MCOR32_004413 [Pyricularia oryzae]